MCILILQRSTPSHLSTQEKTYKSMIKRVGRLWKGASGKAFSKWIECCYLGLNGSGSERMH